MNPTEAKIIDLDLINGAFDYPSYREMIKLLLKERKTTGSNHSDEMVAYTKINDTRMNRWDKTLQLSEEISLLTKALPTMHWLIITEAWCGDAAQNIPFIAKLASLNDNINLKLILRDQHPAVMDNYLTNGARSIPILIMLDENLNEKAIWGPRPAPVQEMVMNAKKKPSLDQHEFIESIHKWYADDKMKTIQAEFELILKKFNK